MEKDDELIAKRNDIRLHVDTIKTLTNGGESIVTETRSPISYRRN